MECSWNPHKKCTEKSQASISTHHISDFPFFQKYLNPKVRTNKLVTNVVYHPCPSRLASGIHPYFFKLFRFLSLSRMLVEFYVNSAKCGKTFSIYGVHIRQCIESMHFYSCLSSLLKTAGIASVPPSMAKNKGMKETMSIICFINIQS